MTTFQTCCSRLTAALLLSFCVSTTDAHSLGQHGEPPHQTAPGVSGANDIDYLLQQYSLTGDDALLQRGQQWLNAHRAPLSAGTLLSAAWLAQAQHDFALARELVEQSLEQQPNYGQAWLLNATVADVTGDHSTARRACSRVALYVSPTAAIVCFASLADTTEQRLSAYARLNSLPTVTNNASLTAWRYSVQGDIALALGHLDQAELCLRKAIAVFPAVQTRAALMDLLLQQGQFAAVLQQSNDNETAPALVVRRLLAMQAQGADIHSDAAHVDSLFRHWLQRGDYRHAREMAIFYLDIQQQVDLAYQVAVENAKLQREPEDLELLRRAITLQNEARTR